MYYYGPLEFLSAYLRLRAVIRDVVRYQFESVVAYVDSGHDMALEVLDLDILVK